MLPNTRFRRQAFFAKGFAKRSYSAYRAQSIPESTTPVGYRLLTPQFHRLGRLYISSMPPINSAAQTIHPKTMQTMCPDDQPYFRWLGFLLSVTELM